MRYTLFEYRMENGCAVTNGTVAGHIWQIFQLHLEGDSLTISAKKAGIISFHEGVSWILKNTSYFGNEYYPAIIDGETYDKTEQE